MNIRISTFVRMEPGDEQLLEELVTDIADVLVARGFANQREGDGLVHSLITVRQFAVDEVDIEPFLTEQLEDSFLVVLPATEKEKESA